MKGQFVLLLVSSLAMGATCTLAAGGTSTAAVISDLTYVTPHRLVDIGDGRKMNIYCVGHGSPTVIFEAGLGDEIRAWAAVQPQIAKRTRACSYDRAGLGFSDPSNRPGTAANAVDDLHRLLTAARVKPPYVMVGHSLGGMYVRLYADDYRSEVAGMVLVEPSSEEQGRRYSALDISTKTLNDAYVASIRNVCIPAARHGFVKGSVLYKRCVGDPDPHFSAAFNDAVAARWSTVTHLTADWSEWVNVFTTSSDQVRAARRSFGDMPLIILTRGPATVRQKNSATYRLWVTLHNELVPLSSRGTNRIISGTGHYIQLDRPDVVVGSIDEVLDDISRG